MPRNVKEAMMFTCLMCGLMVFGMSVWNLAVAGHFSWMAVVMGYPLGFAVAFLADVVIVGPIAKKVAFGLLHHIGHHEKRWVKIVVISACMVLGMVSLMSIYGIVMSGQSFTLATYGRTWLSNFVMAVPLNLLVVGPIARFILGKVQKPFPNETVVEDFDDDDELPTIV